MNQSEPSSAKTIDDLSDEDFDALLTKVWGTGIKVEGVIKFFGLTRCMDTMVGDALTRGISGGEKKRLTTAEMIVGPKTVAMMDEISTGLDSATLFSLIGWISKGTHAMG